MQYKLKIWLKILKQDFIDFLYGRTEVYNPTLYSPCYELMIINIKNRHASFKRYYSIKDAIESVTQKMMFDKENDYLLFNKLSNKNSFIKLNKSYHESNSKFKLLSHRSKHKKVL